MASETAIVDLVTKGASSAWSLGCDITIEEMDVVVEEIKLNDIAIAGVIKTDGITVDIDHDKNNVMDLNVNVVIDGLNSSIVESQVVPYERVVEINDLSPESSYEKGFAASAKSVKKVKDSVDSLGNTVNTNTSNISKVASDVNSLTRRVDRLSQGAGGEDLGGIWYIDETTGNLVTDKQVEIKNNLIVEGDTASTGVGEDPGIVGGFLGVKVGEDEYKSVTPEGLLDMTDAFKDLDVDLSDYYTKDEVNDKIPSLNGYAKAEEVNKALADKADKTDLDNYLLKKAESQTIEGDITIKGNLIVEGDTASGGEGEDPGTTGIDEAQLKEYLDENKYITSDYAYSKQEINDKMFVTTATLANVIGPLHGKIDNKVDKSVLPSLATKEELEDVSGRVTNIENRKLATEVYVDDKLKDVRSDVTSLTQRVATAEGAVDDLEANKADKSTTLAGYGIKDAYTQKQVDDKVDSLSKSISNVDSKYASTKTWADRVSPHLDEDDGNINITTNLIVTGDVSSTGVGDYDSNSKGYYATLAELNANHPVASAGSIAYIGTQSPYSVYKWDANNARWVDSGAKKQDSTPLGDYYTKSETHQAIREEYIVISQTEYDALAVKEDKLYFCYEE